MMSCSFICPYLLWDGAIVSKLYRNIMMNETCEICFDLSVDRDKC